MTADEEPVIDLVIVRRLSRVYHWWPESYYKRRDARARLAAAQPQPKFVPEVQRKEDLDWDFGRVRFFADQLSAGAKVDPISVDNRCDRGVIYPEPLITDGHHRFAAYALTGQKTIPVFYSGRMDVLAYLTGQRAKMPE